jgi:exopolyphosphatase/guanosine-5'-triphosphate,3'-diphosphate pyrophosphatase
MTNVPLPPDAAPPAPDPVLDAVLRLAESCRYEARHTHHVTGLALSIFDQLQDVHRYGPRERECLHWAGLLHDIGFVDGPKGHHKRAKHIIMTSAALPFSLRMRRIVACIARYHRKALPAERHGTYAQLRPPDRRRVCLLAGILRLADGLDVTHRSVVRSVTCRATDEKLVLRCESADTAEEERLRAYDKGTLLERALARTLVIEMQRRPA